MRDKGLNQLSAGLFEGWRAAEGCGVGFDQDGIEVVLADQKAQSVSQSRLAVV